MSALWAPQDDSTEEGLEVAPGRSRRARRLRPLPSAPQRMARVPFLLVLIAVTGVGMAGLLLLNTTLQNQAFASRALQRQATQLTYTEANLTDQLDGRAAPQELARRASALGMRPNPYPALLKMPKGKVIGKAIPVTGTEVPSLIVKTPEQIFAAKVAKAEKKAAKKAKAEAKAKKAAAKAAAKAKAKAAAKVAAQAKAKAEAKAKAKAKAKARGQR
jgi:hypothetical protein